MTTPSTKQQDEMEMGAAQSQQLAANRGLTPEEIEINNRLDAEIMKNPEKMPRAVYYIVPNEFAERFCFYGISPILNSFFRDYMGLGKDIAMEIRHGFNALAYITPLLGAAISDSSWGKYKTIVRLSLVYVLGVAMISVFAAPIYGGVPSLAGFLVGLFFVALGTGGIKPCVAALGGDQFLEVQTTQLNSFYNYFYLSINAGSLIAGFCIPEIVKQQCFGSPKDCYAYAYGTTAAVMVLALLILVMGRNSYRKMPPAGIFVPAETVKALRCAYSNYRKASPSQRAKATSFVQFAEGHFPRAFLEEVRDLFIMCLILLPAPIFWMAFDQNGSTWQNQYSMMNPYWGPILISEEQSQTINSILIIALVPVFTKIVYPVIERIFGSFKLIDRMIVGMLLAAVSFAVVGLLQMKIDANTSVLIFDAKADMYKCDISTPESASGCLHGAWQILPYFLITCGEIMFSISGLNLTYQEVGKKMKASAASLWLFMVGIGNFVAIGLGELYKVVGVVQFMFINTAIIVAAAVCYLIIRFSYQYRADRKPLFPDSEKTTTVVDVDDKKKAEKRHAFVAPSDEAPAYEPTAPEAALDDKRHNE